MDGIDFGIEYTKELLWFDTKCLSFNVKMS